MRALRPFSPDAALILPRRASGARADAESSAAADVSDLMKLVMEIVPFHMAHNAEPEAVDLLVEVERLPLLTEHCDRSGRLPALLRCPAFLAHLCLARCLSVDAFCPQPPPP